MKTGGPLRISFKVVLLAVFAVVVSLGPLVGIDVLVRWVALSQGDAQLRSMARTMVAHAENILDSAATSLEILAVERVDSCTPANIRRIGEVVFTRANVKEIGVVDEFGRMLCSNFGPALLDVDLAAVEHDKVSLVGMIPTRISTRPALALAVRGERTSLLAMIEPSTALLELLHGAARESCHARLVLGDGAVVGVSGIDFASMQALDPDIMEFRIASTRYPLTAVVAAPKAALMEPYLAMRSYAKVGAGGLGAALLIIVGAMLRRRETLDAEIEHAIHADEFTSYYQPIIDARTGRVAGCEALIRWEKPGSGMIAPDLFVPLAEQTGQIIPMTIQLMERVADDLSHLIEATPDFYVSINLVAEQFRDMEIVEDVRRCFAKGPISGANLVFEITERRPLGDLETARKVVAELQKFGARVALDDAGTGHGGLAYIQGLGMDIIKIDRMFVEAIGTGAVNAPIVDALLELAEQLDMKVVAEGVETEEQFAYLRAHGARLYQGYLFSPPLPAAAFVRFVEAFNGSTAARGGAQERLSA